LRNRLNSISSLGMVNPRRSDGDGGKKQAKGPIDANKLQDLLAHFRMVQARHEKAYRQFRNVEDAGRGGTTSHRRAVSSHSAGSSKTGVKMNVLGRGNTINPAQKPITTRRGSAIRK